MVLYMSKKCKFTKQEILNNLFSFFDQELSFYKGELQKRKDLKISVPTNKSLIDVIEAESWVNCLTETRKNLYDVFYDVNGEINE